MDLNSILELAAARGPVFWAAAGAIALGAALLAAALLQLLRGLNLHFKRPAAATAVAASADPGAPEADVYVPTAVNAAASAARTVRTPDEGDSSLALMLRRLQSAGDRLEEIAADLGVERGLSPESALKEDPADVEYVFKACGP